MICQGPLRSLWTNIRGFVIVAASLWTAILVIDTAVAPMFGTPPCRLTGPYVPPPPIHDYESAERTAGVLRAVERGELDRRNFGVIIGASAVRHGINARLLEAEDGLDMRWIVLTSLGGSPRTLERISRPLLQTDLTPSVVVLGLHPTFLVGTHLTLLAADQPRIHPLDALTGGDVFGTVAQVLNQRWFVRNADLIRTEWTLAEFDAKLALACGFDAIDKVFVPQADPWREPARSILVEGDEHRAAQIRRFARFGWFEAGNYSDGSQLSAETQRLITRFIERGSKVYILLTPFHSSFRTKIPAGGREVFARVCRAGLAEGRIGFIDLEGALPDEFLADTSHLNAAGRERFTRLLARDLGDRILREQLAH